MKGYGYPNIDFRKGDDVDRYVFKRMLDDSCPIFYASYPKGNIPGAHAWVIDGYFMYKFNALIRKEVNGTVRYYESESYDQKIYFHCNWGWAGNGDGYYLLSLLDPSKGGIRDSLIDVGIGSATSSDDKKSDHYTKHIRWIYYTNPNK